MYGERETVQLSRLRGDRLMNLDDRFCGSEGLAEPEGLCGAGFYCALGATSPVFDNDTDPSVGGLCAAGYACVEVKHKLMIEKGCVLHDRVGGSYESPCVKGDSYEPLPFARLKLVRKDTAYYFAANLMLPCPTATTYVFRR